MTIAEALVPRTWRSSLARRLFVEGFLILGGSALVALSAYVRVDLPFTPVPITGQTFAVLLTGVTLGARRGALSLLLYLIEGAVGLGVFAGGSCCLPTLLGATGGYLFSYPLAAGLTGWLAERGWDRKPTTTALAMLMGNVTIYAVGLPWLSFFIGDQVLLAGLLPFIPGDIFKLIMATIALPSAWRLIRKIRGDH